MDLNNKRKNIQKFYPVSAKCFIFRVPDIISHHPRGRSPRGE
jgi:hypothetical protein